MKLVLEGRDDAEIATSAAQTPEQIRILRRAGGEQFSGGGNHVGGQQVVARQAVLARKPANATTQCEPTDACV